MRRRVGDWNGLGDDERGVQANRPIAINKADRRALPCSQLGVSILGSSEIGRQIAV